MSESETRAEFAALWRRWRTARRGDSGANPAPPDSMEVAAYAEHRLSEASAAGIEAWLAENLEGIEDLAAVHAGLDQPDAASEAVIARAQALVTGETNVVAFERPRRRAGGLRVVLAWGGMAASIAATGLVGFALGSDTYTAFMGIEQDSQASLSQELFATPTSIFSDPGEEPNS